MTTPTPEEQKKNHRLSQIILGCVSICVLDGVSFPDGIIVAKGMEYALQMIDKNPNRPDDVDAAELEAYIYELMKGQKG